MKLKAKISFFRLVQGSHDYGSDDQHMVSRVFFTLEVGGSRLGEMYADIKQIVGSDFESAPLEVSSPHGYAGPFNQHAFQESAEAYYRDLVGSKGRGILFSPGASARMMDCTINKQAEYEFEIG